MHALPTPSPCVDTAAAAGGARRRRTGLRASTAPTARSRAQTRLPAIAGSLLLGLLLSLCGPRPAAAHEDAADALDGQPGVQVGAAVGWSVVSARGGATPIARPSGWLGNGQAATDRRGSALEFASVDGLWRGPSGTTLRAGWARPAGEPGHVEALTLSQRLALARGQVQLAAGRDAIPMGPVVGAAGHLDRFAFDPFAKRLMLGHEWIDDGLTARWQAAEDAEGGALDTLGLGLWRGRSFPGARHGALTPSLLLGGQLGTDWQWQAFGARARPTGRGTPVSASNGAHTHEAPDCSRSLVALVCFDGRSDLAGLSAQARLLPRLRLQGAWLWQREAGLLYDLDGQADYRALHRGGWLDLITRLGPALEASARLERLDTHHHLVGPGASLVAAAAGLTPNAPAQRQALALAWQPVSGWRLAAELGHESSAGQARRWLGLRLHWQGERGWRLP